MRALSAIPVEIWSPVITVVGGALVGVLGWLLRGRRDERQQELAQAAQRQREEHARRRDRLHQQVTALGELDRLLTTSRQAFEKQITDARRLMASLKQRNSDVVGQRLGYDETFHRLYSEFSPEEHELFLLIRGVTAGSMHETNVRLRGWLERYPDVIENRPDHGELQQSLTVLAKHLREWSDKYNSVFAPDDRRSVVFLRDEKQHGTGFPTGIEHVLKPVIAAKVSELRELESTLAQM